MNNNFLITFVQINFKRLIETINTHKKFIGIIKNINQMFKRREIQQFFQRRRLKINTWYKSEIDKK